MVLKPQSSHLDFIIIVAVGHKYVITRARYIIACVTEKRAVT